MDNSRKLLSLCIPTYNRAVILRESLEHLVPIVQGLPVEIVVLDNASPDETADICAGYPSVRYIRNDENIGGDMNILKSYVTAANLTDYVCVIGDSYRLDDRSIRLMVERLSTREYDMLILSRGASGLGNNVQCYDNPDKLMAEIGGTMDLTGTIVISSRGVREEFYRDYLWSNFIHTSMAFSFLKSIDSPKVLFCGDIVLSHTMINKDSTSWYGDAMRIFGKVWMTTIMSQSSYDVNARLACIKAHDRHASLFTPKRLIALKERGFLDIKAVGKYVEYLPFVTDTPVSLVKVISVMPWRLSLLVYKMCRVPYHLKRILRR